MMMLSSQAVTIRKAKQDDMEQVCQLIKDLAKFEKLESQCQMTTERLVQDGFESDHPSFQCLVGEYRNTKIVGYAIYYICYSTWLGKSIFLEDLYVDPEYRNFGVGKKIFKAVGKIAYDTSKRLDFHVLSWNPATEFYKKLGAVNLTNDEQWQLFRLQENNLKDLID